MMERRRICSDSTSSPSDKKFKTSSSSSSRLQTLSDSDEEIATLPEEIIQEILSRLPVKSLLKCRSVSKSWLLFISNPKFIKTHLKHSVQNADFANHRIIFTFVNPNFTLKQCSVNSMLREPRTTAPNLDYPNKGPDSAVWVVGSINGIVCVALGETDVFLWNPATRRWKELPSVVVDRKPGFYYTWGFGYSESEDDYKVVGLFCEYDHGGLKESMVKIYSLRDDSWKRIEDFSYGVPFNDTGKYAGGKLHFTASKGKDYSCRWNIVSLDLHSEAYGVVEQPDYGEACCDCTLELVGGWLAILCHCNQKKQTDLWVLKESWTRVVSVPYSADPQRYVYSNPLLIMPNGEIVLVLRERIVVYNPEDDSFRRPRIDIDIDIDNVGICFDDIGGGFIEADIYVESLVQL